MKDIATLPDFSDLHILVIGDVMIDRYVTGKVSRISPEAPVPVLDLNSVENRPGGAANVAMNLLALGSKVTLLSIAGDDNEIPILNDILSQNPGFNSQIIKFKNRKTTVKTRVMAGNQHLLRVDNEDTFELSDSDAKTVLGTFYSILNDNNIHGVILQDYNKGLMTQSLIKKIIHQCNSENIPTFVDPKFKNFFEYTDCTLFKPNKKEAEINTNKSNLEDIDLEIRSKLHNKITLITLGADGLYISDGKQSNVFPTDIRKISDVCGAGDTVISIVALCYIKKLDLKSISVIANMAGGQVCQVPGVIPVDLKKLKKDFHQKVQKI